MMAGAKDGNGRASIMVSPKTRDRVKDLIGLTEFWHRFGFKIAPGSGDEVVAGLIDIAERQGGTG